MAKRPSERGLEYGKFRLMQFMNFAKVTDQHSDLFIYEVHMKFIKKPKK